MTPIEMRLAAPAAAAVLAAALALTGCSSDDSSGDAQGVASAAPGAAAGAAGPGPVSAGAAGVAGSAGSDADGADTAAANSPVVPGASRYVLLELGQWFLSEGVKPIGDSRALYLKSDRTFDWYADYFEPDADQGLTVTGRLRGLAAETAALKKEAGKVTALEISGRKAVWADLGGSGGVTVLIALTPTYTIELTTSGVEVQESLRLARALQPADEAAWKTAGGKVLDCPPGGDACAN